MTIFWFRRDLRLEDNTALFYALSENIDVQPIFIFDDLIVDKLPSPYDKRVVFIYETLKKLKAELNKLQSDLLIFKGKPIDIFKQLTQKYSIKSVYINHDYEPYARKRDNEIAAFLTEKNISFNSFKDQVIFEKNEVLKADKKPYTVFTPYMKRWKANYQSTPLLYYSIKNHLKNFRHLKSSSILPLENIGFKATEEAFPTNEIKSEIIKNYAQNRDIPSINGTSRLSIHLRFGTISIRKLVAIAQKLSETYLNELIWREFYMMILWHFPYVEQQAFKKKYNQVIWQNNEQEFRLWCEGKTGYPIVDAGMHELNQTGFMHNRLRMITASFLTKHLLIDWRWGETYFAQKLLDYELASNNGGWQWAASTGCDAVPYFRIFNPWRQTQRFDPKEKYIKHWLPNFNKLTYTKPIVEHAFARQRAIERFKQI